MSKTQTIATTLRQAIQNDGRPLVALAEATGVDKGQLSRFVREERDITLKTAGRLCVELGLELREVELKGRQVHGKSGN